MERVVITGLGVLSPLGSGPKLFWEALRCGESGIQLLNHPEFDNLPSRVGGRVQQEDIDSVITKKMARRISRSSQMAIIAADQAILDANLTHPTIEKNNIGVLIGSSIGGFSASDPIFRDYYLKNKQSVLAIPRSMNSGPSANVSIRHGYGGPNMTVDVACASAAHSIGYAYNLIRLGQIQIAITGGADTPFSRGVVQAWCNLRVVSTRNDSPQTACRPFSADRDGLVLGEGAGILVLEAESSAKKRGVEILAELKGYGASADSHHITNPTVDGPARAMNAALKDAGLESDWVDYINAHGTGTQINDPIETRAIKKVFKNHAKKIFLSGNKGALGHSIGASGALELVGCVLALKNQIIPPTINYTQRDPECDLNIVSNTPKSAEIVYIMSNSFAFGGSNGVLILSHYQN